MNKINILIKGGSVQAIYADSPEKVEIAIFDLDNEPELEEAWEKNTENQKAIV